MDTVSPTAYPFPPSLRTTEVEIGTPVFELYTIKTLNFAPVPIPEVAYAGNGSKNP